MNYNGPITDSASAAIAPNEDPLGANGQGTYNTLA